MKRIYFIFIIYIFFLSGCTGDRCIDADDFGFIKFVISSRYKTTTNSSDNSDLQLGDIISSQIDNQSAPWVNSGYNVNGQPLTILVKSWDFSKGDKNNSSELSAWGPWFGTEDNFYTLSEVSKRLGECSFVDNQMCTNTKDAAINNAPCLLKNGKGLYFLIAERYTDPNITADSQRSPSGITGHLGEITNGYNFYDLTKRGERVLAGGVNYQYDNSTSLASNYSQCPLYFKILDKFYDDNNGQYRVVIKSGVSDTRPDPLEFLTKLIKNELFGDEKHQGLVRSIYENIIKTPGYRITVSAILTLYIMFTAASFLIGNINFTHTELIIRLLKITIVSIMLSSVSSWQFFHDYLFVYFTDGVEEILRIIKETGNSGPGSSSIIGLMIAPQTMAKLFSLLFVDPLGFIYIFLFLIALYFIFMMVFKATIIYLTALITIGMVITMGPIFVCFILFDITRSLFENWLKQLISYAIQPIILFTGIAFLSLIIRNEIYSSLGFAVCKYDFPDLGPINELFGSINEELDTSLGNSIFYWWFPSPMKANKFSKIKANILVPIDHRVDDGSKSGKLCLAYECTENRYLEFPFLDPVKDIKRLNDFFNGKFVQLDGLLLIFVCVYLLKKFNETSVSSARFLSNTSGNLTNIQQMSEGAYSSMKNYTSTQINQHAISPIKNYVKERANKIDSIIDKKLGDRTTLKGIYSFIKNPSMTTAQVYESIMIGRVGKEALSKSVKSSILDEVKRQYGINYSDVNINAISDYQKILDTKLRSLDSNGKFDLDKLSKNYNLLQEYVISKKFTGKMLKDLNDSERKELKEFMKDSNTGVSLKEMFADAKLTQEFQQSYISAHQSMSSRGIGILGKSIAPLRKWQELEHNRKSNKMLKREERYNKGERLYAGYEGIKRTIITGLAGKELSEKFEGNLTGAAWYDFNYDDPRLRTYNEIVRDNTREIEYQKLNNKINKEISLTGEDILSPEYLARLLKDDSQLYTNEYMNIIKEKISFDVLNKLSEGENPVLMGERFLKEKATDNQMKEMIDRANEIENEIIDNDRYISRIDRYEVIREKSEDNIKNILPEDIFQKYEELKNNSVVHYFDNDSTMNIINEFIAQKRNVEESEEQIIKDVELLRNSIHNLDYSNAVLGVIKGRKEMIQNAIKENVDYINKFRVNANMPEYRKK